MEYAPELYAFELLAGGWMMIVMDCVDKMYFNIYIAITNFPPLKEIRGNKTRTKII